jgi:flagellar motor switch protein FliN/FliY
MTIVHPISLHQVWTLKKIAPEIQELNQIPLFGQAPSFDWNQLASLLASRLGVPSLSIQPGHQAWLLPDQLHKGLGHDVATFPIDIAPLGATIYWMMPKEEIKKITSWMLKGTTETLAISSHLLQEGFYQYLLLETLDAAFEMPALQTLTPILHEEAHPAKEKAFCVDAMIQFQGKTCSGRLAIPNELRVRWIQHFEKLNMRSISPHLAHSVELNLALKTGSVSLHQSQWEKLKKGDFVLLDQGSYDPRHSEGMATLMLGNTSLFQLQIEKNKIHLLNFAFIYEDATDMTTDNPQEDPTIEEDFSEEIEDELSPEEEAESVGIKETPLYITVELARIRITLEKLMQLTPGNTLELPLQPDQSVALTVNGQKIGKAELVYLGEQLGIRITDLG